MVATAIKEEGFPEDRIERVGHLKLGFDLRAPDGGRNVNEAIRDVIGRLKQCLSEMYGERLKEAIFSACLQWPLSRQR